jgi:tetratricopeptide (TPR) repeat protein
MAGALRGWWSALLLAALTTAAAPAASQAGPDELARKHFESGVAYLQESDYPNALKAFEKSFELSKRPEILLNVATVHERSGDLRSAVGALERYLELAPTGAHVETVKLRIANLEKRIAEGGSDAGSTEPTELPPPVTTPSPAPSAPPGAPVAPDRAPATQPNRLPAYIAFGVGGLAAAGAVLTGVLAQSEYDDLEQRCAPNCPDDEVSSGKTLALTSTILTGVAVVGVGVGAYLFFTGQPVERAASARRWDVSLEVAPERAGARAVWRF